MDVAKWHMFTSCSSGSKAKRQGRAKAPLLWPGPPPPPQVKTEKLETLCLSLHILIFMTFLNLL